MADSISPQELHSTTHSNPTCKNRSCLRVLCKSLSFLIFLVAIPLFPSQAPNFINQTRFSKLWEPVHLLFIGVVVCYGLFSRKRTNFGGDHETHSTVLDDSRSSYVSRVFHVSSIFEDGFDDSRVSDDKNVYQSWNFRYHRGDLSMVNVAYDGSVVNEQRKSESFYFENGLQASFEAWNSQYFRGESTALVSGPNCVIDEYGENGRVIGQKSLGLPVRRLNSRVRNAGSPRSSNEIGSNSSLEASSESNSSEESTGDARFSDMGPINLEERFNDTVPWRSTSARMEMREEEGSVANGSSHLRPLSADETQFDSLKSHSLRSTTSFSTQSGLATDLPTRLSPSHYTVSELPNSETEELGKNKSYRASYPPASQSPQTTMNRGSQLNARFGNMGPINLEERFNDTVPWRSTSARMEMREKEGSVANGSSHLRPLSADETQFDSLKSHSLRSTTSFSTQSGLATDLPTRLSPSHYTVSELPNSETEELGKNKSYRASYPPASQSPQTTMNRGSQLNAFHSRSRQGLQKNLESEFKNLGGNLRDDSLSSTEKGQASLKSDKKPSVLVKGSSMGKSVRTIRASGYTSEAKKARDAAQNHAEVSIVENLDKSKEAKAGKSQTRRPDKMPIGSNKKSLDDIPHLWKPSIAKYNKERKEASENVAVVSESEADSSDEDAVIGISCHAGDDTNEVDKKAAEFIAKFREQIRLQKVESMERSRRFRRTREKHLGDTAQ